MFQLKQNVGELKNKIEPSEASVEPPEPFELDEETLPYEPFDLDQDAAELQAEAAEPPVEQYYVPEPIEQAEVEPPVEQPEADKPGEVDPAELFDKATTEPEHYKYMVNIATGNEPTCYKIWFSIQTK